jgi:Zn-dependent M28 family amino/carboxypeptidase
MRLLLWLSLILIGSTVFAQHSASPPDQQEVSRIEKTLSADQMQGRKVFTPGIKKAADFIIQEFKAAGLKPLPDHKDFSQNFMMVDARLTEAAANLDGHDLDAGQVAVFSADAAIEITENDHYQKVVIGKAQNFTETVLKYLDTNQNFLLLLDSSFANRMAWLKRLNIPQFSGSGNRIFILTNTNPTQYHIHVHQKTTTQKLTNIVGMLPGKSLKNEYVIFSAHYDHLGIGKPDAKGDSIFNGANDDASGTTAVITLAKYYGRLHNNQRTIIFVAFTAEEVGEIGSAYFSKQINPEKVVAMFNIEMIGTESKWGKNSAYITGFDKTDMGAIMGKNLASSKFRFYPDPYPDMQLFYRSDNATLAKRGVPAHTVSTSKMDTEKYYHQPGDEWKTLDMQNMTQIIQAIALSARSIIDGRDTPQRVAQTGQE